MTLRTSATLAAAAGALLAGCAFQPAPKIELPPSWQALAAAPMSAEPSAESVSALPIDAQWWTRFKNDELDGLVGEALANSLTLKAAIERILQAEAQAKISGAALYPGLSAGLDASRSTRQASGASTLGTGLAGGSSNLTTTSYQGTLQASYQVDLFGQLRDAAGAAREALKSSIYDQQTVAITLVSNVVTSYLQVLSFRERRILAEDRLKIAQEILGVLQSQRQAGTLSDLEIAQQLSAVASEQATIPALRLSEQQSLNALAVLLGRRPEGFSVKAQSLSDVTLPEIAAGIPSEVLAHRPDVRKAETDLKSANFNIAAARAARFPSISLTASGGTASSALSDLFQGGTFFYSLAGSAAETLFAGGRLQGQEQLARGRYRELLDDYKQAVLSAFSDVENDLTAVRNNDIQYGYTKEAFTQADIAYRLADLRYRAGIVDFQTVLNAQNAAFTAQDAVVQTELSRFTAVIALGQALGGGWNGVLPAPPPLNALYGPT